MKLSWSKLRDFVLDWIFPVRCVGCAMEGDWLCAACTDQIKTKSTQHCPNCWCVSPSGQTCAACRARTALDGLRVAASYHENPALARATKTLKYKFSEPLAANLARVLARVIHQTTHSTERCVAFVPLHARRQDWRGFNQAELLATAVARRLDLPLVRVLVRTKNTPQQAKLSRAQRLTNLTGAFAVPDPTLVAGKTVILVDDIASTGTTLAECARVLRAAGAKAVWGLVLARG